MCSCNDGQAFTPEPFAFEEITVSSTQLPLTATVYKPTDARAGGPPWAMMAFITNFGAILRYRVDGQAATASTGHVLADGDSVTICQNSIPKWSAIRKDSTDSELTVTYFRAPYP